METKKKKQFKAGWKKADRRGAHLDGEQSVVDPQRPATTSNRSRRWPFPLTYSRCQWQRVVPVIQCWVFFVGTWLLTRDTKLCSRYRMMERDAVPGSLVTGSTTACGKRLFFHVCDSSGCYLNRFGIARVW